MTFLGSGWPFIYLLYYLTTPQGKCPCALLEVVLFFSLPCSVLTENVYRNQGEYEGGEVGEDAQEVDNVHRSFYKPGRMMLVMMMWERNLRQREKVLSVCLTSGFVYLFDNC